MCIMQNGQLCVVLIKRESGGKNIIFALQLSKGIKRKESTFVAALKEDDGHIGGGACVPKPVEKVLKEIKDIMPTELPKRLPPRREVDYTIELEPGAKPLAFAPYCMSPLELEELRRQLKVLLDADYIRLSKAPYGAPVLFQKKHDDSFRLCIYYRALNKIIIKTSTLFLL